MCGYLEDPINIFFHFLGEIQVSQMVWLSFIQWCIVQVTENDGSFNSKLLISAVQFQNLLCMRTTQVLLNLFPLQTTGAAGIYLFALIWGLLYYPQYHEVCLIFLVR
jgi:hypothetical protein